MSKLGPAEQECDVASRYAQLLTESARLEAGTRSSATDDIRCSDAVARFFCTAFQTAATDRGLFLKMDGPSELIVEGDKTKIRAFFRISC